MPGKFFRSLSFKNIWFWTCILIALIPVFLTGYFVVPLYTGYQNRREIIRGDSSVQSAAAVMGGFFTSCDDACRKLAQNAASNNILISHTSDKPSGDFYLSLLKYASTLKTPAIISIYDIGGLRYFSTDETKVPKQIDRYSGLIPAANAGNGIVYYSTRNPDSDPGSIIIEAAYPIEDTNGPRMGFLVLGFTSDSIRSLFSGFEQNGIDLLLTDQSGVAVFCSNRDFGQDDQDLFLRDYTSSAKEFKNGYACLRSPFESHGYSVLARLKEPPLSPLLKTMRELSVFSTLLCVILCIVLNRAMNTRIENAVREEKAYNSTRLKLFQTQLNPHFLYNTLDTIKWNAKINGLDENAVLAENLAGILRQAISSDPFVTLKEELSLVRNYTEIQKIRFAGSFTYEEEVPDSLMNAVVPKMILQPLVENSILHGLEGMRDGYICVFAGTDTGRLILSVYDNGKGMSKEASDRINNPSEDSSEGHLGLYNLSSIIRLYYGEGYGLHADPSTEEGTTIRITLPYREAGSLETKS